MFRLKVMLSPIGIPIETALEASQIPGKHSCRGRWRAGGGYSGSMRPLCNLRRANGTLVLACLTLREDSGARQIAAFPVREHPRSFPAQRHSDIARQRRPRILGDQPEFSRQEKELSTTPDM